MTGPGRPCSAAPMDTPTTSPATPKVAWYNKPGPALAVGIALLAVCGVFAVLWVTSTFPLARAIGFLSGAAGLMLVYGGVNGLREQREQEWKA